MVAFKENNKVSLRIQSDCGKYGPEKTPYLDTFHAVSNIMPLCLKHLIKFQRTTKLVERFSNLFCLG